MKIHNKDYHTIWLSDSLTKVHIIDQRFLPFQFIIEDLVTAEDVYIAIKDMHLRGAPLIGVAAAYGMYLATLHLQNTGNSKQEINKIADYLKSSRPTAVNLSYAVDLVLKAIERENTIDEIRKKALQAANDFKVQEIENCRKIGVFGYEIIKQIAERKKGDAVNILTHCNAGWLACIDYGTATAPIYEAHKKGIKIHVWVDETRPRNQGARLTAYELGQEGVPHTVIADNTGGHLMQHGMVDMVIVGCDRMTATGDAANKIGTYLKALAAKDNNIPFYVALPFSTIDFSLQDGVKEIPIEERDENEVKYIEGWYQGMMQNILVTPPDSPAANYGFDVTPARLITGVITEKGIFSPDKIKLFK